MTGFFVPSYLDYTANNFQKLADSFTRVGDARIKKVFGVYPISAADSDVILRFDEDGQVLVPEDIFGSSNPPVGTQVAVLNYSEKRVVISPVGSVEIGGPARRVVPPWKVGVLVKHNANFWLLSLGSSSGEKNVNVPGAPVAVKGVAGSLSVDVSWVNPADDGGDPITQYIVQQSGDGSTWTESGRVGTTVRHLLVSGLTAGKEYSFRVEAVNSIGTSDPSEVVKATPKSNIAPTPTVRHSATGQWTITNPDPALIYTTQTTSGAATITNNVVTCTSGNSTTTLSAQVSVSGPKSDIYLERRAITCTNVVIDSRFTSCTECAGCCEGGWNCEDYGPNGIYCRLYQCQTDPTPSGYGNEYGEWFRSFLPSNADFSDGDGVSIKSVEQRDADRGLDPHAPDEVLMRELSGE
jgi:hypothetical protein